MPQIAPPISTKQKFTSIRNDFLLVLVHLRQLRKSQKQPETPYVNQLANKLDTRASMSLNSGILACVRIGCPL